MECDTVPGQNIGPRLKPPEASQGKGCSLIFLFISLLNVFVSRNYFRLPACVKIVIVISRPFFFLCSIHTISSQSLASLDAFLLSVALARG
jgi:hypothetical protein